MCRAGLAFLAAFAVVSVAHAQDPVAWWTASSEDLAELSTRAAETAQRVLGERGVEAVAVGCDPDDAGCVPRLVTAARAGRLLAVRTTWTRGACEPIVRDGVRVGSRMLRVPTIELVLYARDGAVLLRSTLRGDGDQDALIARLAREIERMLAL